MLPETCWGSAVAEFKCWARFPTASLGGCQTLVTVTEIGTSYKSPKLKDQYLFLKSVQV